MLGLVLWPILSVGIHVLPSPLLATRFAAPEKLTGKATASTLPKGEVWSLLTTHCTALVERSPFDMSSFRMFEGGKQQAAFFSQPDAQARLEQLLDTYYTPLLPPDVLAFLKWGLQVDPQQRPSAAEVLAHPYMQGG
jgi:serine/threonine protein kinase